MVTLSSEDQEGLMDLC